MAGRADSKDAVFQAISSASEKLTILGVTSIGVFGSFVRGEQTETSDVDILVEFAPDKHRFDNFMEVCFLLDDLLGRRADVVTRESLSPYIGPQVLRELERVPLAA
jgi:uncharacterized protein